MNVYERPQFWETQIEERTNSQDARIPKTSATMKTMMSVPMTTFGFCPSCMPITRRKVDHKNIRVHINKFCKGEDSI